MPDNQEYKEQEIYNERRKETADGTPFKQHHHQQIHHHEGDPACDGKTKIGIAFLHHLEVRKFEGVDARKRKSENTHQKIWKDRKLQIRVYQKHISCKQKKAQGRHAEREENKCLENSSPQFQTPLFIKIEIGLDIVVEKVEGDYRIYQGVEGSEITSDGLTSRFRSIGIKDAPI